MLSIGKLGSGSAAADYYLRRQAGCRMDYYVGRGERAGVWCGAGEAGLDLSGELDEAGQRMLRALLAGADADGNRLVGPVLRSHPRAQLPARDLVAAIRDTAADRSVAVDDLLADDKLATVFSRAAAAVQRDRHRPVCPRASLPADVAGRLASAAGLDPHEFFRGPDGSDRYAAALERVGERVDVRRAGLDLTFSAPKSVSLLYGLGDEQLAGAVRHAHQAAIADALGYLERSCGQALRGHHGGASERWVQTDGLIGAAFEHRTSRAGDPQLHTHVLIANLLRGVDGKWSAANTRELYRQAATAGYLYQTVLRGQLTRTLGVAWTPVRKGAAEIVGVPTELRRAFSRRRSQIEDELSRTGRSGRAAAQVATLTTRAAKPAVPVSGLRQTWATRARTLGFDPARIADVAGQMAPPALPEVRRLAARLLGPDGLTRRRSTFDRRALLRGVAESVPAGADVDVAALRGLATSVVRDPQVVPLIPDAPAARRRYSTAELLATETAAQQQAQRRADDQLALVDPAAVERALIATPLSAEQQQMVRALTQSGDGVQVVVGPAGSGKTAALAAAHGAWSAAGVQVHGAAVAAIAARTLQDGAGIPSTSLTRLLSDVRRGDGRPGQAEQVLVVDEASMVGTRTLAELIETTRRSRTKLVLVGDPAQLPEIDAGGLFAALSRRLPARALAGNQRQAAGWEQQALSALRDGDVLPAVDAYAAHDRLTLAEDADAARERIVSDFLTARRTLGQGRALMLTSRRADAAKLSVLARRALIDADELGTDEMTARVGRETRGFRAGDDVIVTVNDYRRQLFNGTRGHIGAVDTARGFVDVDVADGRRVQLPAGALAEGWLDHAYALTCHKAQGVTVDVALLYGTGALQREAGYVGMSRGRRANYLYGAWQTLVPGGEDDTDRPRVDMAPAAQRQELTRAALVQRLETSSAHRLAGEQQRRWRRPPRPQARPTSSRRMPPQQPPRRTLKRAR
jgi:conjugative relaxase-like TrwC/TraI family protein